MFRLGIYLDDIIRFDHQTGYAVPVNKYTGRPVRTVVSMHTFGHPVDMEPLLEVCNKYKITIVEDAAESLGSLYRGKHTGGFGKLGILSFNGNKTITTGGGGAILTNDEALADKAKNLTTTAKRPHQWEYFHFFSEPDFAESNYWLNVLLLSEKAEYLRDDILKITNKAGYKTRPAWTLLNKLPMFENCPAMDLSQAEKFKKKIINIPSSPGHE